MLKSNYYKLTDVNNSCLFISKFKSDVVTEKIKLIAHYREYKVPHLSNFLKIKKVKGVLIK